MEKFTNLYLDEIEKQIKKIERFEINEITKSTRILTFLESKLEEIKSFIVQYDFKTEEEEILFFKEIKPKVISKLIYYMSVYKIEMNRPKGSCSTVETYFLTELDRLKHYFDRNIEIYHYYRTGCTHFDKIYFLKNRDSDIPMNIASFLMGTTEFMMAVAMDPNATKKLLEKITGFICDWLSWQKECFPSIDGILILDDIIGFVGEDEFKEFVVPYFNKIFNSIDAKIKFLHNDADGLITAKHLKEMRVNMFNFSFNHSMKEIRELAGPEVVLVGNVPPRDVLAAGTPGQVDAAVRKAFCEIIDHNRIVWSVGGGMPQNVQDVNIYAFIDAVKKYSK